METAKKNIAQFCFINPNWNILLNQLFNCAPPHANANEQLSALLLLLKYMSGWPYYSYKYMYYMYCTQHKHSPLICGNRTNIYVYCIYTAYMLVYAVIFITLKPASKFIRLLRPLALVSTIHEKYLFICLYICVLYLCCISHIQTIGARFYLHRLICILSRASKRTRIIKN